MHSIIIMARTDFANEKDERTLGLGSRRTRASRLGLEVAEVDLHGLHDGRLEVRALVRCGGRRRGGWQGRRGTVRRTRGCRCAWSIECVCAKTKTQSTPVHTLRHTEE